MTAPTATGATRGAARRLGRQLLAWVDSSSAAKTDDVVAADARGIDWPRLVPFFAIHAGCLALPFVGASAVAVWTCVALYALRMFAVTAFYHRYFAHRAFATSRAAQFAFAVLGAASAQRGPLWWASHHRHHHVHSDQPADVHSALRHGWLWSHMGWFMARENFAPRHALIGGFARFPELRFLDRWDSLVPLALAGGLYAFGAWAEGHAPQLGTTGAQMLAWGFCVSTVALYHATFCINSMAHRYGSRRYATRDASRNNLWLALVTFGEGWHNNHHHYPAAARQGFYWWEVDFSWYGLKLLQALGIVWDLKPVPAAVRHAGRDGAPAATPTIDAAAPPEGRPEGTR
jgi:stearoyl-CoA desaturase (delta-9 desaturase)